LEKQILPKASAEKATKKYRNPNAPYRGYRPGFVFS
jgi:hypothetical protein